MRVQKHFIRNLYVVIAFVVFFLVIFQYTVFSSQNSQPEQKQEDITAKRASKTQDGVNFCLTVIPGSKVQNTIALVTMTNMSNENVVIPQPHVMPLAGTLGYKNTIQIKNEKGELLNMTGLHLDFIGYPVFSLSAAPNKMNLHTHTRTWCFELEECFPELTEPGKYTVEFRLISDKTLQNNSTWKGTVDLSVSIEKDGPYKIESQSKTLDLGNGVKMEFVLIPAGSFYMDSPDSEEDRDSYEGPIHQVQITKSFYMGIYEVTQTQYQAVMGRHQSDFKGDNLPVEEVSWNDATEFCRKLSQKEGKTYRLPTEAEWEYACRAGSDTRYSFGDSDSLLGDYAWYSGNSGSTTHSVGQKKPNAWGLYDMHGNVWEWCNDWYDRNYYSSSPSVDPKGLSSGQLRVLRGGSWDVNPRVCRSSLRYGFNPFVQGNKFGFRVVLDLN